MQINEIELNEFGVRFLPRNRQHLVCVTLLTLALSQTSLLTIPPPPPLQGHPNFLDRSPCVKTPENIVRPPLPSLLPLFQQVTGVSQIDQTEAQRAMHNTRWPNGQMQRNVIKKKREKEIKKQKQRQPNPTERVVKKGGAHWPRRSCPLRAGGSTCKKKKITNKQTNK